MQKTNAKRVRHVVFEYLVMTLATATMAFGIHFFKYPNNFVLGGITGLSVVAGKLIPWLTPAMFVAVTNILLLIIGFIFLGRRFGAKTVYCSILLSGLLNAFDLLFPMTSTFTDQTFLELFFAVVISSLCSAIIFNLGGSTGGSDIIGMIIKKYFKIEIGKAVLCADLLIVLSAFFVFDIKTGLFSLFGVIIGSLLIDTSIENLNLSKYFTIITTKPDEIDEYITKTLNRGATRWDAEGCYTKEGKTVILAVMNRSQARRLRGFAKSVDPDAFILISNTSDIIGHGFRPTV